MDAHVSERLEEAVALYELQRRQGNRPDLRDWANHRPALMPGLVMELLLTEFRLRWELDGEEVTVERYLASFPELQGNVELRLALIAEEIDLHPGVPDANAYAARFSEIADAVRGLIADRLASRRASLPSFAVGGESMTSIRPFRETARNQPLAEKTEITLHDVFEIERPFDEGGLKWVHRAYQRSTGRFIALKTSKSQDARRMLEEGRLLARLEHPNIPPVVGISDGTTPALAESLIGGECWADRLEREHAEGDISKAERRRRLRAHLHVLTTLCLPLQYALDAWSLVHLDIKPKNVMLGKHGEVYLLDWGLAVQVGAESDPALPAPHRSQIEGFRGTPAYVSPEMAQGDSEKIGPATDVFLLGAVLHELIVGSPPFAAATPEGRIRAMLQARRGEMPQIPSLGEQDGLVIKELAAIATKATSFDPADRYPNAAAFADAIHQYLRRWAAEELLTAATNDFREIRVALGDHRNKRSHHVAITSLIAVADRFRQADLAWRNDQGDDAYADARDGERAARETLLEVAEEAGDLALAEAQIDRLAQLSAATAPLSEHRQRIRTKASRRAMTRTVARIGVATVVFAAVALSVVSVLLHEARKVADDKTQAETQQRQLAQANETLAKQRAEAIAIANKQLESANSEKDRQRLEAERHLFHLRMSRLHELWREGNIPELRSGLFAVKSQLKDTDRRTEDWHDLFRKSHAPDAERLDVGDVDVRSLAYSPDGKSLAVAGQSKSREVFPLRVWNRNPLRIAWSSPAEGGPVAKVVFSPNGNLIAAAIDGPKGTLCLFSAQEGILRRKMFAQGMIESIGFSKDSKTLFSVSKKFEDELEVTELLVWDLASDKEAQRIEISKGPRRVAAWSLAVDPDGKTLHLARSLMFRIDLETKRNVSYQIGRNAGLSLALSGSGDLISGGDAGMISVLDRSAGSVLRPLLGGRGLITHLAESNGALFAAGGTDGVIRVWNAQTGLLQTQLRGQLGSTKALAMDPSASEVASWDGNQLLLWRLDTVRETIPLDAVPFAVAAIPGTQRVVVAGGGRLPQPSVSGLSFLAEFDCRESPRPSRWFQGEAIPANGIAVAKDRIAIGYGTPPGASIIPPGRVEIRDTATFELQRTIETSEGAVGSVAWSRDGRYVAAALLSSKTEQRDPAHVVVWDTSDWRVRHRLRAERSVPSAIAFSPDGRILAASFFETESAKTRGEICTWECESGKPIGCLPGISSHPIAIAFSADSSLIGAAMGNISDPVQPGELVLWNAADRTEKSRVRCKGGPFGIAFSPKTSRFASIEYLGSAGSQISIRKEGGADVVQTWKAHGLLGIGLSYSSDGSKLASAAVDLLSPEKGEVALWDSQTGKEIGRSDGEAGGPAQPVFTLDDAQLLTASAFFENARAWSVPKIGRGTIIGKSRILETRNGHRGAITAVAAPDADTLVTAGADGHVKVWELRSGKVSRSFAEHKAFISCLACTFADGKKIAATGTGTALVGGPPLSAEKREVRLWDIDRLQLLHRYLMPADVVDLAFSPDGSLLAVGLANTYPSGLKMSAEEVVKGRGEVRVLETKTGKTRWVIRDSSSFRSELDRPMVQASKIVWNSDGNILVVAAYPYPDIRCYRLGSEPTLIHTLTGHADRIQALAWTPDGMLLSGGSDKSIRKWDVQRGIQFDPDIHDGPIYGLAASDHHTIAALYSDMAGTLHVAARGGKEFSVTYRFDPKSFGFDRKIERFSDGEKTKDTRWILPSGTEVKPRLFIVQVVADSVAEKRGIKVGDEILQYDGVAMANESDFLTRRRQEPANGPEKELVLLRKGERIVLRVPTGMLGFRPLLRAPWNKR